MYCERMFSYEMLRKLSWKLFFKSHLPWNWFETKNSLSSTLNPSWRPSITWMKIDPEKNKNRLQTYMCTSLQTIWIFITIPAKRRLNLPDSPDTHKSWAYRNRLKEIRKMKLGEGNQDSTIYILHTYSFIFPCHE